MGYRLFAAFTLFLTVSVASAQEPRDKNRDYAVRNLRKMLLTPLPAEVGIRPTQG